MSVRYSGEIGSEGDPHEERFVAKESTGSSAVCFVCSGEKLHCRVAVAQVPLESGHRPSSESVDEGHEQKKKDGGWCNRLPFKLNTFIRDCLRRSGNLLCHPLCRRRRLLRISWEGKQIREPELWQ